MKKVLFILLLSPLFSMAQCPDWLNNDPSETLKMLPLVQQQLGFELRRGGNPFSVERIEYVDSLGFCAFNVESKRKKTFDGIEQTLGPAQVNYIKIVGPANRVEKLFAYFKDTYKGCPGFEADGQYVMVGKTRIVWSDSYSQNGVPIKVISIDKL